MALARPEYLNEWRFLTFPGSREKDLLPVLGRLTMKELLSNVSLRNIQVPEGILVRTLQGQKQAQKPALAHIWAFIRLTSKSHCKS